MDNTSFDSKRIAEGYIKRPWLHKNVMENLRKDLKLAESFRFRNGLDVGCGAGLSTKALRLICDKVTGTDISGAMINVCKDLYDETFSFYIAKAEETRIPDEKYDIVTAAGCINWVDEVKFLENMKTVTSDNSMIVIYDFAITDRMKGISDYTTWYQEEYLRKFPKPNRKENRWTQQDLIAGFTMGKQTDYEMEYNFSPEEFVDFMMIQSNVNSRIEAGDVSEADARYWMKKYLNSFFAGKEQTLIFSGYSWYIRKI